MRIIILLFIIVFSMPVMAQDDETAIPQVSDSLYREDQFYLGLTYNVLLEKPSSYSQSGFSGGIHFGYIRDMPINKARNKAIGVGLGYSTNIFNHNLFIDNAPMGNASSFQILGSDDESDANRIYTNLVELPIQYRWRTSTVSGYKFWRVYAGIKAAYLLSVRSVNKSNSGKNVQNNIPEVNRLQYGLTFTFGYNTVNFHIYYGLNKLFDDNALLGTQEVGLQPIKFGLEFYIL